MPALKPYRPQLLVRELAKSLRRELDLAAECRHASMDTPEMKEMKPLRRVERPARV